MLKLNLRKFLLFNGIKILLIFYLIIFTKENYNFIIFN